MDAYQGKKSVFIVEDNDVDIDLLQQTLGEEYDLSVFTTGEKAMSAFAARQPDLVLLDVMLPGLSGFELCRMLKDDQSTAAIPIIFLTSLTRSYHEQTCLSMGADDYTRKPIEPDVIRARVRRQLEHSQLRAKMATLERIGTMNQAEKAVVEQLLVVLMVAQTYETASHVQKTKSLFSILSEIIHELFPEMISIEGMAVMANASIFHDIGMVGIPAEILPRCDSIGERNSKDFQRHTTIGGKILRSLVATPESERLILYAAEIAENHHERWNGTGYPYGLKGEEIPLSARIMSLVDTYDLLTSTRAYKRYTFPLSHNEAVSVLKDGDDYYRPDYFDPRILEAFLTAHDRLDSATRG